MSSQMCKSHEIQPISFPQGASACFTFLRNTTLSAFSRSEHEQDNPANQQNSTQNGRQRDFVLFALRRVDGAEVDHLLLSRIADSLVCERCDSKNDENDSRDDGGLHVCFSSPGSRLVSVASGCLSPVQLKFRSRLSLSWPFIAENKSATPKRNRALLSTTETRRQSLPREAVALLRWPLRSGAMLFGRERCRSCLLFVERFQSSPSYVWHDRPASISQSEIGRLH